MTPYQAIKAELRQSPENWLITGLAGPMGSNFLEALLKLSQRVVGQDNFAAVYWRSLGEVKSLVTPGQWARFRFVEGDVCNLKDYQQVVEKSGLRVAPGGRAGLRPSFAKRPNHQ